MQKLPLRKILTLSIIATTTTALPIQAQAETCPSDFNACNPIEKVVFLTAATTFSPTLTTQSLVDRYSKVALAKAALEDAAVFLIREHSQEFCQPWFHPFARLSLVNSPSQQQMRMQ